jgi:hypothetical protein
LVLPRILFRDLAPQAAELFVVDLLVFEKAEHEPFGRAAEEAPHQMADGALARFLAAHGRLVHKRTTVFRMTDAPSSRECGAW